MTQPIKKVDKNLETARFFFSKVFLRTNFYTDKVQNRIQTKMNHIKKRLRT